MLLCRSLPVRGAWIEIPDPEFFQEHQKSLPVRGAWIEIMNVELLIADPSVAPRKGSVD